MAIIGSPWTSSGNYFTSSANGVTTGMGDTVAPAPTPSYTPGMVTDYLNGTNGQGLSYWKGMSGVGNAFMQYLGRMPDQQAREYYDGMITGGANIDSILANIQNSPEAQAYAASGATNPYAKTLQIMSDRAAGIDVGTEAYRTQYGIGLPTPRAASTFDPNSPAAMQADAILAGGQTGRRAGTGGRPGTDGGPSAGMGGGYGLGSNPYQGAQAEALAAQQQQFLDRNFAGIRSNSVGVGGLGGARQGVAQGEAIGSAATGLAGATANLFGSNWNADQNRELQRYGYDQNFYTNNRQLDQSGAQLGANMMGLANNGDWSGLNSANNIYGNYTGFGNTTNSSQSGGGWQGALGGAIGGATLGRNMGWW
jgi:hypothetical protein